MPVTFTKQASVSAIVRARTPTASRATDRANGGRSTAPPVPISDWNVSHSLEKPLSGGSPLIAAAPTPQSSAVSGITPDRVRRGG